MRILLTVHQFFPEHSGGTEVLTLHTAEELIRRGHEVTILTTYPATTAMRDEDRFDIYEFNGMKVHRFLHQHVPMGNQTNVLEMEYNNHLLRNYLEQFLKEEPQDLVHFFHLGRLTVGAVDACTSHGVPTVFTPTDFWPICPTSQLRLPNGSLCTGPSAFGANCIKHISMTSQPASVNRRLQILPEVVVAAGVVAMQNDMLPERWYSRFVRAAAGRLESIRRRLNAVDRILAPTKLMVELLKLNGVHESRILLQHYGINLAHIRRSFEKGESTSLRVGFMGTLYEHKGAHLLIEAVRSLPLEVTLQVKIYGNVQEFPDYVLQLQLSAGDDARIQFCGTFPNAKIGEVFEEMDVLVVPSIWYENTPLVIYSALAAGVPVIATDLGGMSEAVQNGRNGLLFEKMNTGQLASHLKMLANDRNCLRRLADGTSAPKGIDTYVTELEAIYGDALQQHSRRRNFRKASL